ncbi:CASP-like protein 4A1, partial [Empidonax traillii]|uniref:CASP-like protein 4A1 n=1 Tax=Empidonax traillii TaxID=164674 RepID=UPI000FFD8F3C
MAEDRDVRFVTEESFDFGVLSPSDRMKRRTRRARAGGPGAGRAGGAGAPCEGPAWRRWCGRPRAWPPSSRGVTCPPPAPGTPPAPPPPPPPPRA